jgi:predicted porin
MKTLTTACALAAASTAALAQSNAQIYGSIDAGVDYVSNAGGSNLKAVNSGKRSPDRIGFRGSEDLGGGRTVFFKLESGLNSDTGAATRPDVFFNRYTQLGLYDSALGSVTLGHMPDFMYEYVAGTSNSVPGISSSFSPGNLDNLANQFQLDNAIKYESPEVGGFQFGAMNGFGEAADSFSTNRRYAFGAQYRGSALRVSAAYSMFHNRTADVRGIFGVTSLPGQTIAPGAMFNATRFRVEGLGASYAIGLFTPHALVSDVSIGNTSGSTSLRNYEAGVNIDISGGNKIDLLGVSYARSTFTDRRYDQVNLFLSRLLSKRTQVYAGVNYVTVDGPGATAGLFGYTKSSTDTQTLVRVGIQNQF